MVLAPSVPQFNILMPTYFGSLYHFFLSTRAFDQIEGALVVWRRTLIISMVDNHNKLIRSNYGKYFGV